MRPLLIFENILHSEQRQSAKDAGSECVTDSFADLPTLHFADLPTLHA